MDHIQLKRLNMDNSWWMKLGGSSFLIDPWLVGKEVDYFSWFNTQYLRTPPISFEEVPAYDFVIITQKYPDHYHKETLLKLAPTKLWVPKSIAKSVKRLLPEAEVFIFNNGQTNELTPGLSLHHFPTDRKIDPIYDSLVIENGVNSIFISTHGHRLNTQQSSMLRNLPPVELMITPFSHYVLPKLLGGVVAPGLKGVLHLMNQVKPTYVAATHDEDKVASGIVSKFARVAYPNKEEIEKQEDLKSAFLNIVNYDLVGL